MTLEALIEAAQEYEVFAVPYKGKWIGYYGRPEEVEQRLLEIEFDEEDLKATFVEALEYAIKEAAHNFYIDALESYRD